MESLKLLLGSCLFAIAIGTIGFIKPASAQELLIQPFPTRRVVEEQIIYRPNHFTGEVIYRPTPVNRVVEEQITYRPNHFTGEEQIIYRPDYVTGEVIYRPNHVVRVFEPDRVFWRWR